MATNTIFEKYNNLNEEEEMMNNYVYRPIHIRSSEIFRFKKPKKFFVNKFVENFKTNKKGNLKTLREFQNLYIHKFLLNKKKEEEAKNKSNIFSAKCKKIKIKTVNKGHLLNNEIIKQRPSTSKNFQKITNISHNSLIKNNTPYSINNKKYNRLSTSKIYNKNMNINTSLLKKDNINNENNNNNDNNEYIIRISSRYESFRNKLSKLHLIKEISEKLLNQNNEKKNNKILYICCKYSINKKNTIYFNKNKNNIIKLKRNQSFDSQFNQKYIEISRNNCALSSAIIVKRQKCLLSRSKSTVKKRPKIPLRLFSSGIKNMNTLEKYYLKFGVFPFCL